MRKITIFYGFLQSSTNFIRRRRINFRSEASKFLLISISFCLLSSVFCFLPSEVDAESIVMKILVVNPSKDRSQTVPIKSYLPKEIKEGDVLDKGDFKLDYDIQRGLYYIFKDVELKPTESAAYVVELRDVWIFSNNDLDLLKKQAEQLTERLAETDYFEEATSLKDRIERLIDEILRKQEVAEAIDVLPQRHIAVYRENTEAIKFVKADLSTLEKLVIHSGVAGGAKRQILVESTWKIILAVLLFLAILSVFFFVVWHMQVKQQKGEEGTRNG